MMKKILIFATIAVLVYAGYKNFISYSIFQKDGSLVVKENYNINKIVRQLKKDGYIKSERFTRYYYLLLSKIISQEKIKILVGEYDIKKGEKFDKLIEDFINKKVIVRKITIPEGLMIVEILNLINKEDCLIGNKLELEDIDTMEGMLMPDTYNFSCGDSKISIVRRMKKAMDEYLESIWDGRDIEFMSKTTKDYYSAIILASIIERECKDADELSLISAVMHNRLKKRMRLQSCATVEYEITRGKYKLPRVINLQDTKIDGPFNTYTIYGLPQTAISCPGRSAIYATLHPSHNDYLFFMLKPDLLHHEFSENFEIHKKNKINSINQRNRMNIKNERVVR